MLFFIKSATGSDFIIIALSYIISIVLSLCLHEFAHAYVAYKSGDNTPKIQGRVSINPLKHMDPFGFICSALFGFGWAKPVQINQNNFRNIKKGAALTSIAGVVMNLILSFISCGLFVLSLKITSQHFMVVLLQNFLYFMYFINACYAVFNFLPIYPLDGFRFIETFTSYNNKYVNFMYRYGSFILILVIVFLDSLLIRLIDYISYPFLLFWELIF